MKMTLDAEPARRAMMVELSPQKIDRAVVSGLNRASVSIRAELVKRLRGEINLKASALKAVLPIKKATAANQTASIRIEESPIPLIEFVTPPSLKQIEAGERDRGGRLRPTRVKVLKQSKTATVKGGFHAQMKSGKKGIFRRKGKPRLPIQMLFGPSLASQARKIQDGMIDYSREVVDKRIEESIRHQVLKAMGKV